jgi:cell division protein ZapA
MSNVILSIGGRSFTVACAAGEEAHIADLGRMIDVKLGAMGDMSGQNEARMLLFAALLLADELHDAQSAAPASAPALPEGSGERLEAIALQLENLAARLEG